jgi:Fibronectin type III domain
MDTKSHKPCNVYNKTAALLAAAVALLTPPLWADELVSSSSANDLASASATVAVTSFTLIDADSNQPIPGYEVLSDGAVIDPSSFPTSHLNIRANTDPTNVGSVSFMLDDYAHVENISPFALFGNIGTDYLNGELAPGGHVLTATPFSQNGANGTAGRGLQISFTVADGGASPTPTPRPTATPTPTPVSTPTPTPVPTPTPSATPSATPITSVSLAWNASTSANIAGYHVSYGTTSGVYMKRVDVGNKTSTGISGLTSGRTYYFTVSAYNSSAVESPMSNEVSFSTSSGSSAASISTASMAGASLLGSNSSPAGSSSSGGSANTSSPSSPSSSNQISATANAASTGFGSIQSRVHVGIGSEGGFANFVVSGNERKTVVVRVLGPSLTRYGIRDGVPDPMLEIRDARGIVASNDGWRVAQGSLFAEGGRYHGYQPPNELEPAVVVTLPAGTYTVAARGKNNGKGVALLEIYDVSQANGSKLNHVSARAMAGGADNVLVSRLTVLGNSPQQFVARVLGPSLARYGVPNPLQNPRLNLYNSNGTLLRTASNWMENALQASQLRTAGFAPADPREPALIMSLGPGVYTAMVTSENSGSGVAVLDAYTLN